MRSFLAWASVYTALAVFLGHAAYGMYLEWKVGAFCGNQLPPKPERWSAENYRPGVEPWLARFRRWHRRKTAVWLGCLIGGNLLYWLLKP